MDEGSRFPPPQCTKVYIQRDYSDGTMVRFQTKFPTELDDKVIELKYGYQCKINRLDLCTTRLKKNKI